MQRVMFGGMWLASAILSSVGCNDSVDPEPVAIADNDLEIAEVKVERSIEPDGNALLAIDGIDDAGEVVARLELRSGTVEYSYDPDLNAPGEMTDGRELRIDIAGSHYRHVTPDLRPQLVPDPRLAGDGALATFVRLAPVAAALERDAGMTFSDRVPAPAEEEVAFAANFCDSSENSTPQDTCCKNGTSVYAGMMGNYLAIRWSLPSHQACRNSDGSTGCGIGGSGMCYYGPCGLHSELTGVANSSYPKVFTYNGSCAADNGIDWIYPVEYDDSGTWSGVSQGCSCSSCNANGTPNC